MSNLRHRRQLFIFFKISFFLNVFLSLFILAAVFYHRKHINDLRSAVTVLTVYNSTLQKDLNRSIDYITNEFYSASSAFASNCLVNSSLRVSSLPLQSSFSSDLRPCISSNSVAVVTPDLTFSGYFENNGTPYIRLRNKYYKLGDLVLGYPITAISPDVVEYRDRFYKVKEESK